MLKSEEERKRWRLRAVACRHTDIEDETDDDEHSIMQLLAN